MAHTKSQGAAKRTVNVVGKRRGVKKFAGEYVYPGNIIIRQLGTKFHPGKNVDMGKDYTIFAVKEGVVKFRRMTGFHRGQKFIDVVLTKEDKTVKVATKVTVAKSKTEAKTVKETTKPVTVVAEKTKATKTKVKK